MKKTILVSAVMVAFVALNSCKKDKNEEAYDNSTAPSSNATIENAYDEMTNMSDQAIDGNMVYYKFPTVTYVYDDKISQSEVVKAACNVIVTLDTVSTTRSITIDWGTTNCDCNDQKQRRGKIITTFTGKYRDSGTVITHTPVDYYVNDNKIEGSKTVTNMGINSSGQPFFNISVNGSVTMTSGEVFTYSSNRVRTWVSGFSTPQTFSDDEYDITGSGNASSTNGNGYVANITSALHIKVGCPHITKGTIEFTPTGKLLRIIDYGDGTCDKTFTVTINGHVYTVN